jgi:sugar transferase (PEP-CTERM/EpsH1 system associated)
MDGNLSGSGNSIVPAPIRIMHFVDGLGNGGLENGLVNLIDRLDSDRFEHVVCAIRRLGPSADRLPQDRVRVMCLGKKSTDSRVHFAALVRAIREARPEIVHSRNWGAVEAVMAGRWAGTRGVVHSEHGLEGDANAKEPWRRRLFRRCAFELAHHVASVSYQLRDLHARRTGFAAHRISVIHNGVDGRRFRRDAETRVQVRRELGISADEFCIGSVGNLLPVKDHMTLLEAFDRVAGSFQACRLVLFGEGSERSRLEAFADAHPEWRERVSFLGSNPRVAEMLNALDVYVLPSISEGISNSLLEAMATGLPVVAAATGGNPEVIVDGESGLLFPVGDAEGLAKILLDLHAKQDLRAQLGQGALRRVSENFSIDSMVRNYAQMYESLVSVVQAPVRAVAGV